MLSGPLLFLFNRGLETQEGLPCSDVAHHQVLVETVTTKPLPLATPFQGNIKSPLQTSTALTKPSFSASLCFSPLNLPELQKLTFPLHCTDVSPTLLHGYFSRGLQQMFRRTSYFPC